MSRKEPEETERFHAVLFKEDLDYLRQAYGPGGEHSAIGISKAIRTIINQRVRGLKSRAAQALDAIQKEPT